MSHLSAIGFEMTLEAFHSLVQHAAETGESKPFPNGRYIRWTPGEGVELWVQANKHHHIAGCSPHFAGEGRMIASVIETLSVPGRPFDGRCFGYAAPRQENNPYSGLHSFAADIPDFATVDERILIPPVVTLQVAAFAHYMNSYPTESSFVESAEGQEAGAEIGKTVWIQEENEGQPMSEAFLSGRVLQSEARLNPHTQQEFHALLLRVEGGTVDVVSDPAITPRRPVVGTTVAGRFWLSCRVVSELPAPRPGPIFRRSRRLPSGELLRE